MVRLASVFTSDARRFERWYRACPERLVTTADSTNEPRLLDGSVDAGRAEQDVATAAPTRLGMRALFDAHYASISRLLRRLGVREDQLEDASQEVFWVAARRLGDIRADREHAFLYGVALRVASDDRRRRQARPWSASWEELDDLAAERGNPESDLEQRRAREILALILEHLPLELRTVFVLFELEGIALKDIAQLENLPLGTVSSRLRRAREEFSAISRRVRAALSQRGGK